MKNLSKIEFLTNAKCLIQTLYLGACKRFEYISFFMAQRYAKKYKTKTLVHRLSRLSCYSTALGTTILLLILSTMNGMERLLSALFYSHTVALKIEPTIGKTFVRDTELKKNIMDLPGVTDIVETLEEKALIRFNGQPAIVTVKGVSDNFTESDFYRKCSRMDATTFLGLRNGKHQAIVGIGISRLLQLKPNASSIEIFYPKSNSLNHTLYKSSYTREILDISGLFSIEHKIDSKYIIAPINFVERLTNSLSKCTYWEVVIQDNLFLKSIQTSIQKLLPNGLRISNRYEQNEVMHRGIFIERLFVYFIFSLVLLLTALHIFFMLCVLILEKKRDIAILSSLGATPSQIGKLFFYSGFLVSLEGIVYGLILAWTTGFLQQRFGFVTLTRLRSTVAYPIEMHSSDFLYTTIVATLFGALASLWPAKQALKLAKGAPFDQTKKCYG